MAFRLRWEGKELIMEISDGSKFLFNFSSISQLDIHEARIFRDFIMGEISQEKLKQVAFISIDENGGPLQTKGPYIQLRSIGYPYVYWNYEQKHILITEKQSKFYLSSSLNFPFVRWLTYLMQYQAKL